MKQYKVTVNGQSYDVVVEEVGTEQARPASRVATPATAPAMVFPAAATAVPAAVVAAPALSAAPVVSGAVTATIKSPMPGTVLSFKVNVGQSVKRGDVLLILEAMKMENEIVAPQAGIIAALKVPAGSSVNTGEPLVDLS